MATKIKDAAVVTSKYTSNGQEKSRWTNVGGLYRRDDGSLYISLNAYFNLAALPRNEGSDRVIIPLFDPKKREDNPNSNFGNFNSHTGNSDNNDTGIPF